MSNKRQTNAKGRPAPKDLVRAVRRLIDEDGESVARERLEVSAQTLARLAAGLTCQRATISAVAAKLGIQQQQTA